MSGGSAPDVVGRIAAELSEAIAAERVARVDAERLVADSVDRERKLQRALNSLEGTGPGRRPGPRPVKKSTGSVSGKVIDRVLAALRAHDAEPMTVVAVQEAIGAGSRETARKALEKLREEQQVRLAGVVTSPNGRTSSNTYTLMPTGERNGAAGTATD